MTRDDHLLLALRRARLQLNLLGSHIDEVGVALRFRMIDAESAALWLHDCGALDIVVAAAEITETQQLIEVAA